MPMLPSGRHVAILRDSLSELLDNAEQVTHVHKVLAIQDRADTYLYTDVLWLLPEGQASQEQVDSAFLDVSLPRPPGNHGQRPSLSCISVNFRSVASVS